MEGNFPKIKNVCQTPTANNISDGKIFEAFPLKSDMREVYLLLLTPYNILLYVLTSKVRQK